MDTNFIHDCPQCRFLGSARNSGKVADLYVCTDAQLPGSVAERTTIIARYGSDGPDYSSCSISLFESVNHPDPFLREAYHHYRHQ